MDINIRTALKQEAPALTRIAVSSKAYWGYPRYYLELWSDGLTITADFIERNKVWVACDSSTVYGFIAISLSGTTADLKHMWIKPEFINRGLGKLLFKHMLKWCGNNSIDAVIIESDPNAVGFYQSLGAKLIGYVKSIPPPRKLPVLRIDLKTNE